MALSMRARVVAGARVSRAAVRPAVRPVRSLVVRSKPDNAAVETAIKEAEAACGDGKTNAECAAAWDTVEELSAAMSHGKQVEKANSDPLEQFCEGNPDADECRVYED